MGPALRREVEAQLLDDLAAYGLDPKGMLLDWSSACPEGHCTIALGGTLEEMSSVTVDASAGETIAVGWMDFIHGGGDNPLFVFWSALKIIRSSNWVNAKDDGNIPAHIWEKVPESS